MTGQPTLQLGLGQQAVTGERASESSDMKDLATGNGFSVASMPSFDSVVSSGVPDFGTLGPEIAQAATTFINALQLVKTLPGATFQKFTANSTIVFRHSNSSKR